MDKTLKQLVDYTQSFSESEMVDPAVMEAASGKLFDTVAVGILGSGSEPAEVAAKIARAYANDNGATVWGYGTRTSPDMAALANAMMVRTYDYNDGGGSHPSDMIPGILAAGEIAHSTGMEVLTAITLAYELLWGLGFDSENMDHGLDQGLFQGAAVALAVGKLWRLNGDQLAHAASLGLVPNLPLGVSRATGSLSMMKGCATSFAIRGGMFAAMLAREGFTSAPEPFHGKHGLEHVLHGKMEARLPVSTARPPAFTRAIQMTACKPLPAEGNVLGLLELVPRIREFTSVDNIETIDVELAESLVHHIADESKYDPKTRETADHSLPYMMSVALVDGTLSMDSYLPERVADPALRPLMRKFRVRGNKEFTAARHGQTQDKGIVPPKPARIKITTRDGREFLAEVMGHKGHAATPMNRDEYNFKFDTICDGVSTMSREQREKIRAAWWDIPKTADITTAIKTLVGFRTIQQT